MEKEFVQIINKHQGIVHKVCRLYCKNENEAEDLFQDILLQLWKSYPSFNNGSLVSTWMYKVALNTAITRLRRLNKKEFISLSFDQFNLAEEHRSIVEIEQETRLYDAINQLNSLDKALVILYLEDKNYQEMSEIIGISESYVGVKINRIKKRLKEILNP